MLRSYLDQRGNLARLSRTLNIPHSTILGWCANRVPAERVRAVAAATGIAPHALRPDIFEPPATEAGIVPSAEQPATHKSVTP